LISQDDPEGADVATATHLEAVREEPRGSAPGEKGLKSNAISWVSNARWPTPISFRACGSL